MFTNINVQIYQRDSTRAMVSVTVAEAIRVNGLRVIEGKTGLFVSMPSKKLPGGEYQDVAFLLTRQLRDQLRHLILP